jgi:D-alanine-D-alanine ligase-like ATP-grasp enzyme
MEGEVGMPTRKYQQIASKGLKTKILERDSWLKQYLPHTAWYQDDILLSMLGRYNLLYVKPDKGGGGVGIVRVRKVGWNQYECKSLYRQKIVSGAQLTALVKSLLLPDKKYLIQQGISLAKINNRPFDLRLMLQRIDQNWELTGLAAKVAAPGKIVTNFCKGGRPYIARDAVRVVCGEEGTAQKMAELKNLAYKVSEVLNKHFTGLRELGIDVGMDKEGHIWIFEVNTRPKFNMFRKLKNLQMYNKIRNKHLLIV